MLLGRTGRPCADNYDADAGGEEQGEDDAALQGQEQDSGAAEDRVLPGLGQGAGERDGRAGDRADGGWPGSVEERAGGVVATEPVEAAGSEQDEREGRGEGGHGGGEAAPAPRRGVGPPPPGPARPA